VLSPSRHLYAAQREHTEQPGQLAHAEAAGAAEAGPEQRHPGKARPGYSVHFLTSSVGTRFTFSCSSPGTGR
jgi:hypothetical protein